MTIVRPGEQLASTVCGARVVAVKVPATDITLTCDGAPMIPANEAPKAAPDGKPAQTLIGKRYVNADGSVEVLCTASGSGALSCDGEPLTLKAAKPLPASD